MKDNYMIYLVVALVVLVGGFVLFQNMAPQTSDMAIDTTTDMMDDTANLDDEMMGDETMASEERTIVEIAAGDPNFSTLVTAVEAAGLAEALSADGPITVFAPTNDAFAALPAETLEAVLADPMALTDILTYHVVPGNILAEQVVTLDSAEALNGGTLTITTTDDGNVMINDAMVTTADIVASNGVIHVIDTVLLPQ